MGSNHGLVVSWLVLAAFAPIAVAAQDATPTVDVSGITNNLPDTRKLEMLEQRIRNDPGNLDHYFAYAQMAGQIREYEKAAAMYEKMLAASPDLPRIKLELAMVYIRLKQFEKADRLLKEIMAGDLPEEVRKNLEPIASELQQAMKTHWFSGSVTAGVHLDRNANAAPDSGIVNIRIAGQELDFVLDKNSSKREDAQMFAVASLNHEYRASKPLSESVRGGWESSATYYTNEYNNLDELNVQVASVRTGPYMTALDNRLRAGLAAGYTHVVLDNHSYQRQYIGELSVYYVLNAKTRLRAILGQEWRDYINSPTISTLDERDGEARQMRLGGSYLLTPRDILDAEVTLRQENTEREYHDNTQGELQLSYIRQFEGNWFSRASTSYRITQYDNADLSVSMKTRKEKELTAGVSVGKTFEDNVTATLGYEYRDVDANITNYSFDNHRVSSTLGWRF